MSHKVAPKYKLELLTRSRPPFPGEVTSNNIAKWKQAVARHDAEGLKLLFDHYSSSISMLGSPLDQMRDLALALARVHVPYFSTKRAKSSKWNIHEHAKFLVGVQQELKKGKDLGAAVRSVGNRLPRHLWIESVRSLKKRYYLAQEDVSGLVRVNLAGDIKPLGKTQGRLFQEFLRDDYYLGGIRCEPCPDDPDAEIVTILPTQESQA